MSYYYDGLGYSANVHSDFLDQAIAGHDLISNLCAQLYVSSLTGDSLITSQTLLMT